MSNTTTCRNCKGSGCYPCQGSGLMPVKGNGRGFFELRLEAHKRAGNNPGLRSRIYGELVDRLPAHLRDLAPRSEFRRAGKRGYCRRDYD
jgi:hypothetical protein